MVPCRNIVEWFHGQEILSGRVDHFKLLYVSSDLIKVYIAYIGRISGGPHWVEAHDLFHPGNSQ